MAEFNPDEAPLQLVDAHKLITGLLPLTLKANITSWYGGAHHLVEEQLGGEVKMEDPLSPSEISELVNAINKIEGWTHVQRRMAILTDLPEGWEVTVVIIE